MSGWKKRARAAGNKLRKATHGQREIILSAVGNGLNPNTVRREIQALAFADRLKVKYPHLTRVIDRISFGAMEVLSRWSSFDEKGALAAGEKAALGEPLKSLKLLMQAARKAHAVPTREEYLLDIARSISAPLAELLGGRLGPPEIPSKRLGGPPIDLQFQLTAPSGVVQRAAAIVVGPFRSAALYHTRRHDVLWRAMGLAWVQDHIIVVLPSPRHVPEYRRWLVEGGFGPPMKVRPAGGIAEKEARPSVHVVGIEPSTLKFLAL